MSLDKMILKVKQYLGYHIDEFKHRDIVVEIGYTLKYIILDEYKTVYWLRPMWKVDGRFQKEFNWIGKYEGSHEKFLVEGSMVKVGRWDFDGKREFPDD